MHCCLDLSTLTSSLIIGSVSVYSSRPPCITKAVSTWDCAPLTTPLAASISVMSGVSVSELDRIVASRRAHWMTLADQRTARITHENARIAERLARTQAHDGMHRVTPNVGQRLSNAARQPSAYERVYGTAHFNLLEEEQRLGSNATRSRPNSRPHSAHVATSAHHRAQRPSSALPSSSSSTTSPYTHRPMSVRNRISQSRPVSSYGRHTMLEAPDSSVPHGAVHVRSQRSSKSYTVHGEYNQPPPIFGSYAAPTFHAAHPPPPTNAMDTSNEWLQGGGSNHEPTPHYYHHATYAHPIEQYPYASTDTQNLSDPYMHFDPSYDGFAPETYPDHPNLSSHATQHDHAFAQQHHWQENPDPSSSSNHHVNAADTDTNHASMSTFERRAADMDSDASCPSTHSRSTFSSRARQTASHKPRAQRVQTMRNTNACQSKKYVWNTSPSVSTHPLRAEDAAAPSSATRVANLSASLLPSGSWRIVCPNATFVLRGSTDTVPEQRAWEKQREQARTMLARQDDVNTSGNARWATPATNKPTQPSSRPSSATSRIRLQRTTNARSTSGASSQLWPVSEGEEKSFQHSSRVTLQPSWGRTIQLVGQDEQSSESGSESESEIEHEKERIGMSQRHPYMMAALVNNRSLRKG